MEFQEAYPKELNLASNRLNSSAHKLEDGCIFPTGTQPHFLTGQTLLESKATTKQRFPLRLMLEYRMMLQQRYSLIPDISDPS